MNKPLFALAFGLATAGLSPAAVIAVNFSENDANQGWLNGASLVGPLKTPAQYFNSTNSPTGGPANTRTLVTAGNLRAGTISSLVDDSGAAVSSVVTWTSSNTWYNADTTATDEGRLAVGYLDDGATSGGFGVQISVTNIPYASYRVLGLVASDQGGGSTYTTLDFTVNGSAVLGGTATAYNTISASNTATGSAWSPLTTSTTGNYWTSAVQTSSTLTLTATPRSGASRASITGFIIQQVPEPSTAALACLATLGAARRRRRA